MLFKGTATRSAQQIAQTIDSIGGQLDAFTAKEYASYYIKVLDEHLPIAVDLLGDMILRPALAPADIDARAERHPRRNQDGRGRARRSGARGVRAAVLAAASARPADSRHAGDRRRRSTPTACATISSARTSRRICSSPPPAYRARSAARSGRADFADLPRGRRRREHDAAGGDVRVGRTARKTSNRAISASARRRIIRRTTIGTRCTC